MFKRTCTYCHVSIEVETIEELGLKIDRKHVEINERRRKDKDPYEKYLKELQDFKINKSHKDFKKVSNFNSKNGFSELTKVENINLIRKLISSKSKAEIHMFYGDTDDDPFDYSIGKLKVEIINEEKKYGPRKPIIILLPEQYIECKICGHKYYLDDNNEYGFPTI